MSGWPAVLREALATAKAQPIASAITIAMVAGMCATVLLTTGRTVGAEQAVLGSIDSAGTRSIIIRADPDSGLTTDVLANLARIEGVEWAGAFSAAQDVTNSQIAGGTKVPQRLVWGAHFGALGVPDVQPLRNGTAWASADALTQLGMPDGVGGITSEVGLNYAIAGQIAVPDYLAFLEPLVIVPQIPDSSKPGKISVLVVIATRPDLVSPVSKAVLSMLAVDDPSKITFSTSESLATLRALVEGQLGSFGRNLVLVIFACTAVLVAIILFGLVMLRRKDFGRRRALGASQSLIVALLLVQMAALSLVGSVVGGIVAAAAMLLVGDPLPGIDFFVSVGLLATCVGVVAALVPAVVASRRDPITELRVP